jgi:hypothetical protein
MGNFPYFLYGQGAEFFECINFLLVIIPFSFGMLTGYPIQGNPPGRELDREVRRLAADGINPPLSLNLCPPSL